VDMRSNPVDNLQRTPTHLPSLLASILFALGGLLLLGIGLLMGFSALMASVSGDPVQAGQTIFFVAFGFEAILLFAAAFFAFQKTLYQPVADQTSFITVSRWQILVSMLIAASVILTGSLISRNEQVNWLLLPLLTIPAVVFPLGVLLTLGTQRLPLGTRWQSWTVLGLSMTLVPLLLLVVEAVLGILLFIIVIAYVSLQPELASRFQALAQQIVILGPQSQAAQDLLSPILTNPGVIITALIYIAILVPAIEELLKPLGVWLLAGRLDSIAQGFTLGALSGAGYALIETVGVSGQASEWGSLLFTRVGTGLLHITTSALMGTAIVFAWRERRYLHLIGMYLLAVLLHGLWNAFAMLYTFSTFAKLLNQAGRLGRIQLPLIMFMSLLAVALFVILIRSNQGMRKRLTPPVPKPVLPAETVDPNS
jgi:PrsW family intramembrane metalloprotease